MRHFRKILFSAGDAGEGAGGSTTELTPEQEIEQLKARNAELETQLSTAKGENYGRNPDGTPYGFDPLNPPTIADVFGKKAKA